MVQTKIPTTKIIMSKVTKPDIWVVMRQNRRANPTNHTTLTSAKNTLQRMKRAWRDAGDDIGAKAFHIKKVSNTRRVR